MVRAAAGTAAAGLSRRRRRAYSATACRLPFALFVASRLQLSSQRQWLPLRARHSPQLLPREAETRPGLSENL